MTEERKYWVPALDKANRVLSVVSQEPGKYKLIDLSRRLDINKSSMFSLLHTMETLQWVKKGADDTYSLGEVIAVLGSLMIRQFDLQDIFQEEAAGVRDRLQETIQLARRIDDHILYLGKVEAPTPVRLQSEPGMRLAAHATALGKVMLAQLPEAEWERLYPGRTLAKMTPRTIDDRSELFAELTEIRKQGYALDDEEAVIGFQCVAAPIYNLAGEAIAAVSCSMPLHQWEQKAEATRQEIVDLARRLSRLH
ncbi:IclR family transcriptional regulator [Paenibacillus nasutitermitis]|uniref:Transcriptional regulator n=1 Tax=Paenibacillus nasutitermitis TaxID=1652958 RepID=A0A917DNX2_9BACL|nr:IclR family transcriptional regulator [Paenibacillus nasutitermitis]GGD52521.1 transcriptional regulator [Paenibacillus nasutitermitis]